jgi:hypothetical protein
MILVVSGRSKIGGALVDELVRKAVPERHVSQAAAMLSAAGTSTRAVRPRCPAAAGTVGRNSMEPPASARSCRHW